MSNSNSTTIRIRPTTISRAWELAASGLYKSVYVTDDSGNRWNLVRIVDEGRVPANMGWVAHFEWAEPR